MPTLTPSERELLVTALTFDDLARGNGSPAQVEAYRELEWRRCKASCAYFLDRYGWILMKDGSVQRWHLWPVQEKLLKEWARHESTVAVKARQLGITTLSAHFALWECMFLDAARWTLVSASEEKAKDIISRVQATKDRLPRWMLEKAQTKTENPGRKERSDAVTKISFGLSEMKIVTSTPKSIKGAIGNFILDEFTEHTEQKRKWHMLLPAIDGGGMGIIIANGEGEDYFYHIYKQAQAGHNRFNAHFFKWSDDPNRDESWYESMERAYLLDNPDADVFSFRAQYPRTEEEAFFISGNSRFDLVQLNEMMQAIHAERAEGKYLPKTGTVEPRDGSYIFRQLPKQHLRVFDSHKAMDRIVCGADPAGGGRAGDYAAAQYGRLLSDGRIEQIATYQAKVEPSFFAYELDKQGRYYNDCFMVVEANNHGAVVIDHLKDGYYNLYMRKRFSNRYITQDSPEIGFWTDRSSKPRLIDQLAKWLAEGKLIIHDEATIKELSRYVQDPENSEKTSAPKGANDDLVMALALMVEGAAELDSTFINSEIRSFLPWE